MATNFPTGLDTLTNPNPTDATDSPSHSGQHTNSNDAIEAMQAKIGINSSGVTSSLDYKVSNVASSNPGHKHTLADGATDVTASSAELSQLAGVSIGGNASGDVVTTDDTQTLTGKTIDADNNTISNLAHGAEVDSPTTAVHGVTGDVVGTSDTQDLSNKTVTDTLVFSQDNFANLTMQGTEPATPATGDVYLDDGTNTASGDPGLRRYNGATWEDVSGGTVSPLTTKGDLFTFDTDNARLASSGVNGQVLRVNTATATGLEWGAASGYTPPVTTKGDLFGFDTAAAAVPVGTNGQVLTADSTDAQGVSWQSASSQALVKGEVPSGTMNGSNVTFTLATTPISNSLQLYLNGIRLKLTDDYTITGNTITMGTAPNSGDILLADYATSTGTFSTGSTSFIYNETPSGTINGTNTAFDTASNFVGGSILVYLDGQLQKPGASYDYVETDSNTITFNTAPVSGSVLLVSYQSAVSASGNADTVDGYSANATATANTIPVLDSSANMPANTIATASVEDEAITAPKIEANFRNGWISSSDTWTYASANTFTIAGVDRTSQLGIGTKLKFTQTTDKYAVVSAVTFSTNTTVTIIVNTDYTIANAAITSPFYSYADQPPGFPSAFSFTPTFNGFSVAPTGTAGGYSISGRIIDVHFFITTGGTSNATTFTANLPVTCSSKRAATSIGHGASDNGVYLSTPTTLFVAASGTVMNYYKDAGATAWTASGTKSCTAASITYSF